MSTDQQTPKTERPKKPKFHRYPLYSPRFWHGMLLTDWLGLAARNRFRIHPIRWPMAALVTGMAAFNSTMRLVQQATHGRKIAETALTADPIFIIGHWRSGTTFLHELLSVDERFCTPNSYQCFSPTHFLVSEWLMTRVFWFVMPEKRPMDNVAMGWSQPQEDEFALCNMGLPSPYLRMAFPNHPPVFMEYLDMEGVPPDALEHWKQTLRIFLQELTIHQGRRIVLKSPTHTGRVGILGEMFPEARFIHIVRDPMSLVPSTIRLWQSLDAPQGFQIPKHRNLEDYVFESYQRMYGGMNRQRASVGEHRILDVRYEDLVADPVGQLQVVYERLDLGEFDAVRPKLEQYATQKRDYKPNRHQLSPELERRVREQWADYIERYGYAQDEGVPQ